MKQDESQPETFADVLELLEPLTSSAFAAPAMEIAMRRAERLPPVPCGGFEFSLLHYDGVVDLMQCHALDERGAQRLIDYIDRTCDVAAQPWEWLRNLASRNRHGIAAIWLEFDAKASNDTPPSVFLEFDRRTFVAPTRIYELLDAMPLANVQVQQTALKRIFEAMPEHATISHLGAMFSRSDTPLRVNIKRLRSNELENFISRLGLGICTRQPTTLMKRAYRATLCLDVIEDLLPRLGIEYSFSGLPAQEEGWIELSQLVSDGALLDEKWEILQKWTHTLTPIECPEYWPSSCILDELIHPQDGSSIIECGTSHIKATYAPGRPTTLKAYVGFRPSFREQDGTVTECDGPMMQTRAKTESFWEVIERGVDFLLEERTQDGLWRDFDFANLSSDEWVSGYIGAHMLEIDHPATRPAAQSAWEILRHRRGLGDGWGYHRLTQPDADSTAWVLILAQRLGLHGDPLVKANTEFLRGHLDDDGAVATYSSRLLERMDQPLPPTEAHGQWHGEHGEVTASTALAGLDEAIENLLETQRPSGSWKAFWIASDAYSTGLACEALSQSGKPSAAQAVSKAARWALDQLPSKGISVFDLSWLIRAAFCDGTIRNDPRLTEAVRALAAKQRSDGSWNGDCGLIVPIMDASGSTIQKIEAPDIHASFTTATALVAIERARQSSFEWQHD